MCARDLYANVDDFDWYISVLVDLAYVAKVDIGPRIRDQLIDVALRVKAARPYAVQVMAKLLMDDTFLVNSKDDGSCVEILSAAAWVCGEYCRYEATPNLNASL